MKISHWRAHSISVIGKKLIDFADVDSSLDPVTFGKWISEFYPFGQRAYTPYKIWLEEVKKAKSFLKTGLALDLYPNWSKGYKSPAKSKKREQSAAPVAPGQLSLLD